MSKGKSVGLVHNIKLVERVDICIEFLKSYVTTILVAVTTTAVSHVCLSTRLSCILPAGRVQNYKQKYTTSCIPVHFQFLQ
jgi:hypothetical protein